MTKKKLWEHEERVVIRTEEEYKYMSSFYDKVIEINRYESGGFLPDFDADTILNDRLPALAYVRFEVDRMRWAWDDLNMLDGEVEVDGVNLYFDDWKWGFVVESIEAVE